MVPPTIFRCPTTGLNVQWTAEEIVPGKVPPHTYVSIACPACTQLHFINKQTGKLLGEK
jgi:hypothetical protein